MSQLTIEVRVSISLVLRDVEWIGIVSNESETNCFNSSFVVVNSQQKGASEVKWVLVIEQL